jgi:hypothetical protein
LGAIRPLGKPTPRHSRSARLPRQTSSLRPSGVNVINTPIRINQRVPRKQP